MQFTRREVMSATAAGLLPSGGYFGLHPFIEANPKAVFIRRTKVPQKTDSAAKLAEGQKLIREILVRKERAGIPLSHKVVLKPNFTSVQTRHKPAEAYLGTGTDANFYEGLLVGMKEIGLRKFHWVEANSYDKWNIRGMRDINYRHGVEMNEPDQRPNRMRDSEEVVWTEVKDGVIFKRLPHFAPVNHKDTFLFNIAKWKAHEMVLTQAAKNVQGLVVLPWVRFCSGFRMVTGVPDFMKQDIREDAEQRVRQYFENHSRIGYARYDCKGRLLDGITQEIWAHKTCDNHMALKTDLAMVEGIYGRDGNGFEIGNDHMANIVLFGKDNFRVDLIGLWLGGHEPGNVNLYRIARERGLTDTFNPWEVPIFEWVEGKAVPRKLSDFERTPLVTPYLKMPNEPEYHLVNERFDYDRYKL